jgi:hypothetical protein
VSVVASDLHKSYICHGEQVRHTLRILHILGCVADEDTAQYEFRAGLCNHLISRFHLILLPCQALTI